MPGGPWRPLAAAHNIEHSMLPMLRLDLQLLCLKRIKKKQNTNKINLASKPQKKRIWPIGDTYWDHVNLELATVGKDFPNLENNTGDPQEFHYKVIHNTLNTSIQSKCK